MRLMANGGWRMPPEAKVPKAAAISSVETSFVPSTAEQYGRRRLRIPILWATSTTRSG
jgi:hypothetical protein